MKHLALAILAVALLSAAPLRAEDWSKTYAVSESPELRVETTDANIRVETWDQPTIEATIISTHYKFGPGGLNVEEHQAGNAVEIILHFPHESRTFNFGNKRVDINIHMPRKGGVRLRTGDGKIDLADFTGDMEIGSGDGSQTIRNVNGRLRASTGDGHIEADGQFEALNLKTGDGHLDVRAATGSALSEDWVLHTGDGSISLEIPDNLSADLYLHTGDGHIDVNFPMTTEGRIKENEVRGKLNGGGKLITVHTGDGSISIRKG